MIFFGCNLKNKYLFRDINKLDYGYNKTIFMVSSIRKLTKEQLFTHDIQQHIGSNLSICLCSP